MPTPQVQGTALSETPSLQMAAAMLAPWPQFSLAGCKLGVSTDFPGFAKSLEPCRELRKALIPEVIVLL